MKKIMILVLSIVLIILLFLVGCGGGPGPNPGQRYIIKMSVSGSNPIAKAKFYRNWFPGWDVYAADLPVKASNWIEEPRSDQDFTGTAYLSGGLYFAQVGCQVKIYDVETHQELTLTPEQWDTVIWTRNDSLIVDNMSPSNMVGPALTFRAFDIGVYSFTITYEGISTVGQIAVIHRPTIDPWNLNTNYKTSMVLSSNTETDDLDQADFWYSREADGYNYLNAPNGIAQVLEPQEDPFISDSTDWQTLGLIKAVPSVTFVNQLKCQWYGTYIIRCRNGGYAKFLNTMRDTDPTTGTQRRFMYSYSANANDLGPHW